MSTPPRIDVIVYRPTDGYTDVVVYIDGVPSREHSEWTFDDGNGNPLSQVRESAHDGLGNPETPEGIRQSLVDGYRMEQDGDYIEDDSVPCSVCGQDVTEYPTNRKDDEPLVGYLDEYWELTGNDGHAHTTTEEKK